MLLLDHNLPHQPRELLKEFGLHSETVQYRGWSQLRNGELTSAAYAAGFRVILTRDMKFAESASKILSQFPEISVVVIQLHQRSWRLYSAAFRAAWARAPIVQKAGKMIFWP